MKDNWISCKERLPHDNREVIVCVSGTINNCHYHRAVLTDDNTYEDGTWYIKGAAFKDVVVHAWMPIPEMYVGDCLGTNCKFYNPLATHGYNGCTYGCSGRDFLEKMPCNDEKR